MKTACAEVRATLSAWLDGATSPGEARSIEAHLLECPGCSVERTALEKTGAILSAGGRIRAPGNWRREAVRTAATLRAPRRGALTKPVAVSRIGASWTRPAAFSSVAAVLLAGVSLYLFLLRPSALEPAAPGLENEIATQAKKENSLPAATQISRHAQPAEPAPPLAPSGLQARQAMGQARRNQERPSTREESRENEKAESPPVAKLLAPPAAFATGFAPARIDALAKREKDSPLGDAKGAESVQAESRAQRITLAQIRFLPPQAHDRVMSAIPRMAAEPATAPGPKSAVAAGTRRPEIVRVLAVLDPDGKVLSARAGEENPSPEAAGLVARLIGATIDPAALPSFGPTPREVVLEIELEAPANP